MQHVFLNAWRSIHVDINVHVWLIIYVIYDFILFLLDGIQFMCVYRYTQDIWGIRGHMQDYP